MTKNKKFVMIKINLGAKTNNFLKMTIRVLKLVAVLVGIILLFCFLRYFVSLPTVKTSILSMLLAVSSAIFSVIGVFFVSDLWHKYSLSKDLQGIWSSNLEDMIFYAGYFFDRNQEFKKKFTRAIEEYCIVNTIISWREIEKEQLYLREIGKTFSILDLKEENDSVYRRKMIDCWQKASESLGRLEILGKEKLFPSQWFILFFLSFIIGGSLLLLERTNFIFDVLTLIFLIVIFLILWMIYAHDTMQWNIGMISYEQTQRILDDLGIKRFYLTKVLKSGLIKPKGDYRTEKDLTGRLKELYDALRSGEELNP